MDLLKKCMEPVELCLRDANMAKESIDEVVLVGGSTRIPKVHQLLQEFFNGKPLCQNVNPDEAVAQGAGILAAHLTGMGNEAVQDMELIDVTPLSLGVGLHLNVMDVVIPKNSPIPTKKEQVYHTICDDQTWISFPVFQGERAKDIENYLLGTIDLGGIPSAPKGEGKVTVCFEIDACGILNVSVREITTGVNSSIQITGSGSLSYWEIRKMIEDAERYKAEDEAHKKKAMAHGDLDDCVSNLRAKIKGSKVRASLLKEGLSVKDLEDVENQIEEINDWLDENPDAEMGELEDKKAEFYNLCKQRKLDRISDLLRSTF